MLGYVVKLLLIEFVVIHFVGNISIIKKRPLDLLALKLISLKKKGKVWQFEKNILFSGLEIDSEHGCKD